MAPVATDSLHLGSLPLSSLTSAKIQHDGFNTRAIHVGSDPSSETNAVIPAISLSTTYKQDGIGKHKGYEYTRSSNPNRAALEQQLASLESGGAHALAFASGSATTAVVLQSLGPNAHVLSVNDVYGGTFRYMTKVGAINQGLQTTFIDLENESDEGVLAAIKENTKLIWIESPTNPTLRLIDVPRIVRLAHSHPSKPLVLVDNTFASPFYISPLLPVSDDLPGVDLVMHSLTKYVNGHSDVLMGALILPERHSELLAKLIFLQNAIGAVPGAFDCWLAMRGAKTLGVRMKQHGINALRVAQALEKSPYVTKVIYPGLASHPRNDLAKRMLSPHARRWIDTLPGTDEERGGFPFSGMVTFRIAGGRDQSEKFLTSTRLFTLAESLGGVESLAELPEEMTHGSIPPAERLALGITPDLIRLSVGIEEPEDLVADVLQALERACSPESPKEEAGGSGSITPLSDRSLFECC